jgi:hypothetical protein
MRHLAICFQGEHETLGLVHGGCHGAAWTAVVKRAERIAKRVEESSSLLLLSLLFLRSEIRLESFMRDWLLVGYWEEF